MRVRKSRSASGACASTAARSPHATSATPSKQTKNRVGRLRSRSKAIGIHNLLPFIQVRLPNLALPSISRLRIPPIPPIPRRVKIGLSVVAAVVVVIVGSWTVRHAWAIYRLNRGVGDTVFYDALGRPWFRLDEQRRDVKFDDISTSFKDAVIAVEDHRFYLHPGIDPVALTRAAFYNLRSANGTQGGSTLTQQLARTLFLSNQRTYGRKVKEAALAVMLEIMLSKREILELYFNRIYLSGGICGIETMSEKMLGKHASQLTLGEA